MRDAITGVRGRLSDVQRFAQEDLETLAEYVDRSTGWVMEHVSFLHRCGDHLQASVGDIPSLTARFPSYPTLAGSVHELLGQVEELRAFVGNKVNEVFDDIESIDVDLNLHIPKVSQGLDTLARRVGAVEQHCSLNSTPSDLTSSNVIRDCVSGHPLMTLGELIAQVSSVQAENAHMRSQVEAQGGVTLGSHIFTSMNALEVVLVNEMPADGLMFVKLFVDINIMPCHNPNVDPGNASSLLTWDKATKDMSLKGYTAAARKVVCSFQEIVSSLYTDGKEAVPGQKIAAFKSTGEWTGEEGRDGRRQRIEEKLLTARIAAVAAIESKLKDGSKLRMLALSMIDKTYNWYVVLHRHLDAELVRLTQMKLDSESLLVLLSKEVIIMFTLVHNIRKKGLEFLLACDPLAYMVQCIWLTIEIHGVMEEMIKHGISSNSAINAAFVRFLSKQVAVTAGSKADNKLEGWQKKITDDTAKAMTVATDAKNVANGAQVLANKAKEDIKNLYAKNKDLKK